MILTSNPNKIVEHDVKAVGIADHCLVYCVTSYKSHIPTETHRTIEIRNFKQFHIDDFILDSEHCPLSSVEEYHVDEAYQKWKCIFTEVCNKHCPFITRCVTKIFLPWINDEVKEDITIKHYFMKKTNTKSLEIFWQMFKYFRNLVSNSLKVAKRNYYTGLILEYKHKPKMMWKYWKERIPGKVKVMPKGLLINGEIVVDGQKMANFFNEYFTSINQDLANMFPPAPPPFISSEPPGMPVFKFPSVNTEFVLKQLPSMPENKAVGLDKLPGKLLRAAASIIAQPLAFILNISLQSGKFISEWKYERWREIISDPFIFCQFCSRC